MNGLSLQDKQKILSKIRPAYGHTFNYRFIKNVSVMSLEKITDKQKEWLDKILYTYRRQFVGKRKELIKANEREFINYLNTKARLKK